MIKSTIKSLSPQHIKSTVIGNTNVMVSSTVKEGGDVEIDPVFRNSVAYTITQQDVDNWNAGAGVDLSAYVTKEQLVNQSYITINDVTYPDYSNTYQAKGEYITPTQLVNQSYITINDVTYPDYSNTYQAVGDYVTASDLSQQSYLTSESDPIFSASVAANITQQDVDNWNTGASVDLSSYVTYDYLSAQSYLTNETEPAFNNSPAASITTEDIENWDRGGSIDLSSYVTYDYLSAQSYLTNEAEPAFNASPAASITDTDIANWNAAAGTIDMSAYVTKNELVAQSYIQTETEPAFNNSPAATITTEDIQKWDSGSAIDLSSYVTKSQLTEMSYVTKSELSAQSYIQNESDPVFSASPAATITTEDIQNWNSGGSVDLSSYVTYDYLSEQSYVKHLNDDDQMITVSYNFPENIYTKRSAGMETRNNTGSYWASFKSVVERQPASNNYYASVRLEAKNGDGRKSGIYATNNGISLSAMDGNISFYSPNITMRYKNNTAAFVASYDYIADVLNAQSYITSSQIASMSYVTTSDLSAQSYVSSTQLTQMSYVSSTQLTQMSYVTHQYLSEQSYLTNETEPAFNNSPAASITAQDIRNWNTGALIDLSTYVTKQQLSNQSYVTNWTNDNDQIITVSSDFTTANTKIRAGIRTRTEDATYCASFISSIENNYRNTYYVCAGVEANYGEDKKSGIYATNTGVGLTALDGNIRFASPNISMDYKDKVSFVASYDYVGETLAAQSYITINDVVFPDYSDTYQAIGDYVTPAQLSAKSYIDANYLTTNRYLKSSYAFTGATGIYTEGMSIYNGNVFPSSFSYTGVNDTTYYDTFTSIRTMKKYVAGFLADVLPNYTTKTELDAQSYVTTTNLSSMSYITNADVSAMSYVTKQQLSAQSYITPATLSAQSYVTSTALSGMSYTSVQIVTEAQYEDRQDNILYVISDAEPVSDLITRAELMTILANYMPKPDVLYETDGTTGLLGENANSMNLTNWQLQNLDFTPYRYVLAFIKQADLPLSGTNNQYATPALVVYIPLDAASKSTQYNAYIGSTGGTNMNDPDVHFIVQCAIDSTKTKFKVVNEGSVAGTIWGDRNNNGRYCYKIEGYK